jgi:predicted transcriptional regulator
MTDKISQHKVSKMMELHFQGHSQSDIAKKINVDQSTVSLYVNRFKTKVDNQGLEIATKEYGITDMLQSLHSLAADLQKVKLTVEEAKTGLRVHQMLNKYGIDEENYMDLIEACARMHSDGYLNSAMKLNQLEKSTGLGYADVVTEYQTTSGELKEAKDNLRELTTKVKASKAALKDINETATLATRQLNSHMEKVGLDMKRLQMVESLAVALKKGNVGDDELGDHIKRQSELNEAGISLDILTQILKKAKVLTIPDQGKALLKMLSEYGSLAETIKELKTRINEMEKQTSVLEERGKFKEELETYLAALTTEKASLEKTVAHLSEERDPSSACRKT